MEESEYETAGEPLRVWIAPRSCKVKILTEEVESPKVLADIVTSPIVDEVVTYAWCFGYFRYFDNHARVHPTL